jgi:hypothetical protein
MALWEFFSKPVAQHSQLSSQIISKFTFLYPMEIWFLPSSMKNSSKSHHSADNKNKVLKFHRRKMNKSSNQQYLQSPNMANKVKTFRPPTHTHKKKAHLRKFCVYSIDNIT